MYLGVFKFRSVKTDEKTMMLFLLTVELPFHDQISAISGGDVSNNPVLT